MKGNAIKKMKIALKKRFGFFCHWNYYHKDRYYELLFLIHDVKGSLANKQLSSWPFHFFRFGLKTFINIINWYICEEEHYIKY